MKRLLGLSAATAACLAVALPTAANAASWGPISSYYSGLAVVTGSGTFNNGSSSASGTITITDPKNDGNTVYGRTRFQYRYYNVGLGGYVWETFYTLSIPEFANTTKSNSSGTQYASASPGLGTRGASQVCAQMGWPVPDSCQSTTTP